MGVKIAVGVESFDKLIEGGYYFVDKTPFIKEILAQHFEVNLITRPRRFGKTLTMSMLEDFFDISRDSRAHFDKLAISEETELCGEWMNKYPVVSLSLKSVEGLDFEGAYERLEVLIANTFKRYAFLLDSEKVAPADKKIFNDLIYRRSDRGTLSDSLRLLTHIMAAHYGKSAILLIDEYDVPLQKAHENGYYREMLDIVRSMLGSALKTNPDLKFGIITGCLKISKESIFTGLNNLVANTITTDRFDESIGFTESEVQRLLADAGFSERAEEVRAWYDGYRFGRAHVYCPWDVLHFVADLIENPNAKPDAYWANTSSNDLIYKLFENSEFNVNEKFEALLDGGCIVETITENLTYDSIEASEENLWSLLFMTGYLTRTRDSENKAERRLTLKIPNEEIKQIFQKAIVDWFKKNVRTIDRTKIFDAFWNADAEMASREISDLLFQSVSYNDYKESYYHAFVAGLFAGAGYIVESNYEYGDGRPDVVIKERKNRRAILLEVKHAEKRETISHACERAAEQIKEKRYAEALDGYRTVLAYGVAFKGKDCLVKEALINSKMSIDEEIFL